MRSLTLLPILVLLASACTSGDEPRAQIATTRVDLPRIGTLGRLPEAERVLHLELFSDGTIRLDGSDPLGLIELRHALAGALADPSTRRADRSSKYLLLIFADKAVPWAFPQWVLQIAADPRLAVRQVFFAARPLDGRQVGAIATPLPPDRGSGGDSFPATPLQAVKLFAPRDLEPSAVSGLFAEIAAQARTQGGVGTMHFDLSTPPPFGPRVATGSVIEVLDVLARAGARTVTFSGTRMPGRGSVGSVAWLRLKALELKARRPGVRIRLGATLIPKGAADAAEPRPQGLLPRLYGFLEPASQGAGILEEVPESEPPAAPPRPRRSDGASDDQLEHDGRRRD